MARRTNKARATGEETIEYFEGLKEDKVQTLPVERIDLYSNEFEFRLTARLNDLVESIRENGQQFPIIVRAIPDTRPRYYEVVSGYRRVRALEELGIPDVKAIVRDLDDETAYKISFMENEKRKNLTGVDKAHAIAKLRVQGKSTEEICGIYDIGPKQLRRYERVGEFHDVLKDAVMEETIQTSHGLLLAQAMDQYGDKMEFEEWIRRIEEEELTVRQLKRALNKELGKPKKKVRYFEKRGKGFRLYPMWFDPDKTDDATRKKMAEVLKKALGALERK